MVFIQVRQQIRDSIVDSERGGIVVRSRDFQRTVGEWDFCVGSCHTAVVEDETSPQDGEIPFDIKIPAIMGKLAGSEGIPDFKFGSRFNMELPLVDDFSTLRDFEIPPEVDRPLIHE